jgi:hypothetical protein
VTCRFGRTAGAKRRKEEERAEGEELPDIEGGGLAKCVGALGAALSRTEWLA